MHIHILGIAGTFMSGIAQLATQLGHQVTGADQGVYPPVSDILRAHQIEWTEGYDTLTAHKPDIILFGNAMKRGLPVVEQVLEDGLPYTSGPQWLRQTVLDHKQVLAVAGTHGKTTTTSMLAWIFETAGLAPSFLIGGMPGNFTHSARLTQSPFFIIEADEYDTAFFDKRAKFVHYKPHSLIINNLEFDHADIFKDLTDIQRQFHHLVRTVPRDGIIVYPQQQPGVDNVIEQGCWSRQIPFGHTDSDWTVQLVVPDGSTFQIFHQQQCYCEITWPLWGAHNVHNALAATIVAHQHGIKPESIVKGLTSFQHSKRRMEYKGCYGGIEVYDDFAHHPTAIAETLAAFRARAQGRVICVVELRSYTMRHGCHGEDLYRAFAQADETLVLQSSTACNSEQAVSYRTCAQRRITIHAAIDGLIEALQQRVCRGDTLVVMSNGAFDNIHERIAKRFTSALAKTT